MALWCSYGGGLFLISEVLLWGGRSRLPPGMPTCPAKYGSTRPWHSTPPPIHWAVQLGRDQAEFHLIVDGSWSEAPEVQGWRIRKALSLSSDDVFQDTSARH